MLQMGTRQQFRIYIAINKSKKRRNISKTLLSFNLSVNYRICLSLSLVFTCVCITLYELLAWLSGSVYHHICLVKQKVPHLLSDQPYPWQKGGMLVKTNNHIYVIFKDTLKIVCYFIPYSKEHKIIYSTNGDQLMVPLQWCWWWRLCKMIFHMSGIHHTVTSKTGMAKTVSKTWSTSNIINLVHTNQDISDLYAHSIS